MFSHLSTGAADDLAKVTDIARAMVTRYGMTKRLGHVALDRDRRSFLYGGEAAPVAHDRDYSEVTAAAVDEEVRKIVDDVFDRTVTLLRQRRDVLERSAHRLLEKETLDDADLQLLAAP